MQKPTVFLYSASEHMDSEIKNIIPITIAQKMKYLGGNLTKHVQDLYAENYKTLRKEIKEDQNK